MSKVQRSFSLEFRREIRRHGNTATRYLFRPDDCREIGIVSPYSRPAHDDYGISVLDMMDCF